MARHIDADKAFAYWRNIAITPEQVKEAHRLKAMLDRIPTADVRPNMHLAWEIREDPDWWDVYTCPVCKHEFLNTSNERPNYCLHCGADFEYDLTDK